MKTGINIFIAMFVLLFQCLTIKADWPILYTGEFSGSSNASVAITTDYDGNIYITGVSQTADQGEMFYYTLTTICYYPWGVQKWKTIHPHHYGFAEGVSIIYEPINGFVYVTGEIDNETEHSPDIITIKYRMSDGKEEWIQTFDPYYGRNAQGFNIASDCYGNVYVVGQSHGTKIGDDLREFYLTLIKYAPNGNFQWVATHYKNYNDIGYSLKIVGQYVYVTGLSSNGNDDDFITIKYDLNGNEIWVRTYDSGGNDTAHDIAVNSSFGIYVTGSSYPSNELRATTIKYNFAGEQNWINYDYLGSNYSIETFTRPIQTGGIRGPSTYTVDIFTTGFGGTFPRGNFGQTMKYSSDGGIVWRQTFIDENPLVFKKLKIDNNENIFVTGYDYYDVLLPWLPVNPTIFTLKYNSAGLLGWSQHINNYSTQVPYGLALDVAGNVFLTGLASPFSGVLPFEMYWPHEKYYFTMMYASGDSPDKPMQIINNCNVAIPSYYSLNQNYPNPFNPGTKIEYVIPINGHVSLKVYDMLGREVQTLVNEFKNAGNYTVNFDGSKLSSGVYMYKLQAGQYSDMKKMVLIK